MARGETNSVAYTDALLGQALQRRPPRSRFSHGLADSPEEWQWPLGYAGKAAAPSVVAQVPAERRVDHVVEEGLIEPPRGGLFLLERRCDEPVGDLRFHRRAVRPSVHRRGAIGPEESIGGS